MARLNFEQPFIYGFMSRRELFVAVIPAYYLCYRANDVRLRDVVQNLIFLLKIYVGCTLLASALLDAEIVAEALAVDEKLRFGRWQVLLAVIGLNFLHTPVICF